MLKPWSVMKWQTTIATIQRLMWTWIFRIVLPTQLLPRQCQGHHPVELTLIVGQTTQGMRGPERIRHANAHNMQEVVNLHDIIEYTANTQHSFIPQ
jgi:hypothetical protein